MGQGRGLTNRVWHKSRGRESIRSDTGLSAGQQAFQLTSLLSSTTLPTSQLSIFSPSTSEGINGLVGVVAPLLILRRWRFSSVRIRLVRESRLRSAHTSSLVTVTKYWLLGFVPQRLYQCLQARCSAVLGEDRDWALQLHSAPSGRDGVA